jgi:shikimate kinase
MIRSGSRRQDAGNAETAAFIRTALGARSIVMVGLMGCGKSSVGRRLASRLELNFVDADDEIEASAGKTIPEIFADHGEAYFRDGERKVIRRLLEGGPRVLATGGGAYMNAETRANIKRVAISVWLKAELPVLMRRVMKRDNRPLIKAGNPEEIMRNLMQVRYPVYAEADIVIESREVQHDVIVSEIMAALAVSPVLLEGLGDTSAKANVE